MPHRQGYNWMPKHDQYKAAILDYIAELKPVMGMILTEDYAPVSEAYGRHPHTIVARSWDIDDHSGRARDEISADPIAAARKHWQMWTEKLDRWRNEAAGKPFPGPNQLVITAANEPNQGIAYPKIVTYSKEFATLGAENDQRMALFRLGCGHPAYLLPDGSVDWRDFEDYELEEIMLAADHLADFHTYFQAEGPNHVWTDETGKTREDYPYLAGRNHGYPLQTYMVELETGVDGYIYDRNPGWGFRNYGIQSPVYAGMLEWKHDHMDPRSIVQCDYGMDYQNDEWWGYNTVPEVLPHILAWARTKNSVAQISTAREPEPPAETIYIPVIKTPGDTNGDKWNAVIAWILGWEGGFQQIPEDPGNWTGGSPGAGENKGTNMGISAASYPHLDIKNLTLEQAADIYFRDYWLKSGAHLHDFPTALALMDAAVLSSPSYATTLLSDSGGDPYRMAAKRLDTYTRLGHWETFGRGWVRRMADLLETMRQGITDG